MSYSETKHTEELLNLKNKKPTNNNDKTQTIDQTQTTDKYVILIKNTEKYEIYGIYDDAHQIYDKDEVNTSKFPTNFIKVKVGLDSSDNTYYFEDITYLNVLNDYESEKKTFKIKNNANEKTIRISDDMLDNDNVSETELNGDKNGPHEFTLTKNGFISYRLIDVETVGDDNNQMTVVNANNKLVVLGNDNKEIIVTIADKDVIIIADNIYQKIINSSKDNKNIELIIDKNIIDNYINKNENENNALIVYDEKNENNKLITIPIDMNENKKNEIKTNIKTNINTLLILKNNEKICENLNEKLNEKLDKNVDKNVNLKQVFVKLLENIKNSNGPVDNNFVKNLLNTSIKTDSINFVNTLINQSVENVKNIEYFTNLYNDEEQLKKKYEELDKNYESNKVFKYNMFRIFLSEIPKFLEEAFHNFYFLSDNSKKYENFEFNEKQNQNYFDSNYLTNFEFFIKNIKNSFRALAILFHFDKNVNKENERIQKKLIILDHNKHLFESNIKDAEKDSDFFKIFSNLKEKYTENDFKTFKKLLNYYKDLKNYYLDLKNETLTEEEIVKKLNVEISKGGKTQKKKRNPKNTTHKNHKSN